MREYQKIADISKVAPVTKEMVKTLTAAITEDTLTTSPEAITGPLEKLSAAIGKLVEATNGVTNALANNSQIQLEETNILWWLFGEHSRDQLLHMSEVGFPGACLVVGKELADLTVILPGPRGAIAFLDKMLRTAKATLPESTKLLDAVNDASKEWRSEWISSFNFQVVEDLCPVHLATARSVDMTGKSSWVAAFESATGLKARKPITPLNLSQQTYEESLLIRTLS